MTLPPNAGLESIWAPYVVAHAVPSGPDQSCQRCADATGDGPGASLVVARATHAYAALHPEPQAPGHLLVAPYRHVVDLPEASMAEAADLAALTRDAMRTIRAVSAPGGFNLGINLGLAPGNPGPGGHLVQQVVPRWPGDHNFMPVVGRTRTLPELLEVTRDKLVAAWPAQTGERS